MNTYSESCAVKANGSSVYADSSEDPFDDPKVETIVEIFRRITVRFPVLQNRLVFSLICLRVALGVP